MKPVRSCILFACALLMTLFSTAQTPSFVTDSLDRYIEKGLNDWQLPGLSIVIVKDGKVVWMKGYGVTNITTKEKVNENTLFFIASNTKLFTGTALAQLDFQQKLSLNDKITKYYPEYKLYEKTSTDLVSIKDMLCHRIGTKTFQGDFTFWNSELTRDEIMKRMQYLKPVNPFRQDFGYCNSCFMTAGQIIPKVTGRQWEDYIMDSILKPLGMNNSYTRSNGIEKRVKNMATPYTTSFTETIKEVPFDHWDNLGPAASIVSNVNDLSHWLLFQLDSGRYNGKQVMPWPVLQKTRDVNILTGSRKSSIYPVHFRGYGLGVFAADYNGRQVYWHTGGAGGMVSNVCFVPEERLGIAILTNNDNQSFFESLRYQVLDAYLGVPYVNRSEQQLGGFREGEKTSQQEIAQWKKKTDMHANIAAADKGPMPALPIEAYSGEYDNQLYGNITIQKTNAQELKVIFHGHADLQGSLLYMDNGEWLLRYNNIEYGIFKTQFKLQNGKVISVDIKANDFVEYDPYTFVKRPSKANKPK